jgi:hypothetical protein
VNAAAEKGSDDVIERRWHDWDRETYFYEFPVLLQKCAEDKESMLFYGGTSRNV